MASLPFDHPLVEFEKALDASIDSSSLWKRPRHLVLAHLLGPLRDQMVGGVNVAPRPRAGDSWMDRLPALVPYIARCPDADEMSEPSTDLDITDVMAIIEAMSYGHAAELYPDLWRGWRTVKHDLLDARDPEGGNLPPPAIAYLVDHPSQHAADLEVRDIVLGRLAAPWGGFVPGVPSLADRLVQLLAEPGVSVEETAPLLAVLSMETLRLHELPLLDDTAMQLMSGATLDEFAVFRDACVAWALAHTSAATHCMNMARSSDGQARVDWLADAMMWSSPVLPVKAVVDVLQMLTGLARPLIEQLLGTFSEPHIGSGWKRGRAQAIDGFFPPFWRLRIDGVESILISPWHLQSNVTQHSLVSRFAKSMQVDFDRSVSSRLEPALLSAAVAAWSRIPGVVVRTNENWSCGEIRSEFDVLVFDPTVNTVVHVQAKGSIPAISSRMVERLETTIEVGLRQLGALRSLDASERDSVLSKALGVEVRSPEIADVMLTSSGIGSVKAWSMLDGVSPMNPVLLSAAVTSAESAGLLNVVAVIEHASALLEGLVADAQPAWEFQTVPLGLGSEAGTISISFPSLRLDTANIERFRRYAWPD